MAEKGILFAAPTSGDGASAYTEAEVTRLFRALVGDNPSAKGVLHGLAGELAGDLAVSGSSSPLTVAPGAAIINGYFYSNTSNVNVAVSTPSATTGHRIVLRINHSAKTIRITLISSANGVATFPAITQVAGTTWDLKLYGLTITSGGVITLTDEREFIEFPGVLPDDAVDTDNIADDAVTGDKLGVQTLPFFKRQGGSSGLYRNPGTGNYDVGSPKLQAGSCVLGTLGGNATHELGTVVTFPTAYTYAPLVVVSMYNSDSGSFLNYPASPVVYNVTTTGFAIALTLPTNNAGSEVYYLNWIAIGE